VAELENGCYHNVGKMIDDLILQPELSGTSTQHLQSTTLQSWADRFRDSSDHTQLTLNTNIWLALCKVSVFFVSYCDQGMLDVVGVCSLSCGVGHALLCTARCLMCKSV
jgi:hypothetical protein